MKKLNLTAILSDSKRGQHRRNAEDFIKSNPNAPDADLCTDFYRGGIHGLDKRVVSETCQMLKDCRIEVPSMAKEYILERSVKDWFDDPQREDNLDASIAMPLPCGEKVSGENDPAGADDELVFDPMMPKLSALDRSPIEKVARFGEQLVKNVLAPLVRQGSGGLSRDGLRGEGLVQALGGEVVGELLVCFRGLLVMTFADEVEGGNDDYDELTKPPRNYSLAQSLCATLRAAPTWKKLREDYLRFLDANATWLPALRKLSREVEECSRPIPLQALAAFLDQAGVAQEQLSEGRCNNLIDTGDDVN